PFYLRQTLTPKYPDSRRVTLGSGRDVAWLPRPQRRRHARTSHGSNQRSRRVSNPSKPPLNTFCSYVYYAVALVTANREVYALIIMTPRPGFIPESRSSLLTERLAS